jgi:sugar-phosphatase
MRFDVDAVLFDMDGTLVDSTAAVVRCWLRWAEEYDVDPRRLAGSHGRPSAQIVAALMPPELVAESQARIDQLEVSDTGGVVLLPGATELLATLPAHRWAVATSCTAELARARIEASGLVEPKILVTASDVERGKPDPQPYLLAAERLGVDPRRCLVVEDAPAGLVSARAAGATTVAVTTTHPPEELRPHADAVVPGLSALRVAAHRDGLRVQT